MKKGVYALLIIFVIILSPFSYALSPGKEPSAFSFNAPNGDSVNLFTGDFSYSIPLVEIQSTGGLKLPLSLSYSAGITVEDEASWVGLGWHLSPGAITRNVQGIPDDYSSDKNKQNRFVAFTGNLVRNLIGKEEKLTGYQTFNSRLEERP